MMIKTFSHKEKIVQHTHLVLLDSKLPLFQSLQSHQLHTTKLAKMTLELKAK